MTSSITGRIVVSPSCLTSGMASTKRPTATRSISMGLVGKWFFHQLFVQSGCRGDPDCLSLHQTSPRHRDALLEEFERNAHPAASDRQTPRPLLDAHAAALGTSVTSRWMGAWSVLATGDQSMACFTSASKAAFRSVSVQMNFHLDCLEASGRWILSLQLPQRGLKAKSASISNIKIYDRDVAYGGIGANTIHQARPKGRQKQGR